MGGPGEIRSAWDQVAKLEQGNLTQGSGIVLRSITYSKVPLWTRGDARLALFTTMVLRVYLLEGGLDSA